MRRWDPPERGILMTAAQFEDLQVDEAADVLAWRFDTLCRSGYDLDAAAVIAANVEVDLHRAVDLVERGCPPAIASRILL
jgi:hypothetical protein